MKILIVNEKYDNKKLIDFLKGNFPALSNSTIYKTLRKKDIKINDKRISDNCLLQNGDEIKIYITDNILNPEVEIPVEYEDENIIVYNKPAGIEVLGENSLTDYAKKHVTSYIEPCHRLDRNTSGLIVFAKNESSHKTLLSAFENHLIVKHYRAMIYGIPKEKSRKLKAYHFKDAKKSLVYISDKPVPKYKEIITSYTVIQSNKEKNLSLLDIVIETGRTHQIRAHMAHIGFPIIGDGKYGINSINKFYKEKKQMLTSYSLSFNIPSSDRLSYLNKITIKQKQNPFMEFI